MITTMYQSTGESNSFRLLRLQCSNVHGNMNYDQLNLSRHYRRHRLSHRDTNTRSRGTRKHFVCIKIYWRNSSTLRKFRATENHSRCRVYPTSIPEASRKRLSAVSSARSHTLHNTHWSGKPQRNWKRSNSRPLRLSRWGKIYFCGGLIWK